MSTATAKTLIYVYPARLWPIEGGGAARAWALIDALRAAGWHVVLVTVPHGSAQAEVALRVDELLVPESGGGNPLRRAAMGATSVLRLLPMPRGLRRGAKRWLYGGTGSVLDAARVRALEPLAQVAAIRHEARAMIATYAHAAPCLDGIPPDCLRVLDTLDVQHLRLAGWQRADGGGEQALCTRAEEIAFLERAQVLLAIQDAEAEALRAMCPDCEVLTVPPAAPEVAYQPSPEASRTLLFAGNLYGPNIEGMRRFLDACWRDIRAAEPEARLVVCGRVGEALPDAPGLERAGLVDDLAPYYRDAALVLAPIAGGTGFKVKTLEGLAHGRCVAGSPDALCGFPTLDAPPVFTHGYDAGMSRCVVTLLRDAATRHAHERAAHEYARTRYRAERVFAPLLARLEAH
jgi:hypothetical protein